MPGAERKSTATSNFGSGRREGHDASGFYARFTGPRISGDSELNYTPQLSEPCIIGDSRQMAAVADRSVALVVTSPPYFAGKQYEEELDRLGIPGSYLEYLDLLREVFAECIRKLEPGGRFAVNVANLGRKPYRSLAADVVRILQDDLGLLLRGEVIWQKGSGASGSCAWGSFRSAANPVLRDLTERVIIASNGRFDRARPPDQRRREGLPFRNTLTSDEFMEATLDVWEIPTESARRVGHPAPFPVELPKRLIELYTYEDDLVLDPFMGSGSTLVAAVRTQRRYVGYDLDPDYVQIARARVAESLRLREAATRRLDPPGAPAVPVELAGSDEQYLAAEHSHARAIEEGRAVQDIARAVLEEAGFSVVGRNHRLRGLGVQFNYLVTGSGDDEGWLVDVSGAFTTTRGGLLRTDTVLKALGRAHVLANNSEQFPQRLLLLTSHLPVRGSEADKALRAAGPTAFFDAVALFSEEDRRRLAAYAAGGLTSPLVGFWTQDELAELNLNTLPFDAPAYTLFDDPA